ncbi:MAG: UDPGP type 1 family protein, partial [Clostridia bacterium]|nr:UDPGP type 1 family protein [Clostridia bacterium]
MDLQTATELLKKYNQTQLLDYYDVLDDGKRRELLSNIAKIDFSAFESVSFKKDRKVGELSPADALPLAETEKRRAEFEKVGLQALKGGKVAAVLLAGGQGTSLGQNAPK